MTSSGIIFCWMSCFDFEITQIGYGDEFMKITELCIKYALGKIIEEPKLVTGGLDA